MRRALAFIVILLLLGFGWGIRQSNGSYAKAQARALASEPVGPAEQAELASLRTFVAHHTGASVTVQLTAAYQAAAGVTQSATASADAANAALYAQAQAACNQGHANSIAQAQCNQQFLESHMSSVTPTPTPPNPADYNFKLTSPVLTGDAASILLVIGGIGFIIWLGTLLA